MTYEIANYGDRHARREWRQFVWRDITQRHQLHAERREEIDADDMAGVI